MHTARSVFEAADLAVAQCTVTGGRLWLYAGSVQTLEYVIRSELRASNENEGISATVRQLAQQTRNTLQAFAADKFWLAALAEEGNVFDSTDPEDEQLIRALSRFGMGAIKLLTRDVVLCERYPSRPSPRSNTSRLHSRQNP